MIALIIVCMMGAGVAGMCWALEPLGFRGIHKDWLVQTEAATLVQFSDHILIARFLDETTYETPNSPYSHPNSPTSFVDLHRRFEVVESLKGDFGAGDIAHVGGHVGLYKRDAQGELQFRRQESNTFAADDTYVLFLNRRFARQPPDLDVGIGIWTTTEGLGVARVDSQGRLSFETNTYYRAALKDMDLKPVDGSGAPFELTIDGIRELVATGLSPDQP